MKYLKIILFWTALSGALGLIIKYSNSEVEGRKWNFHNFDVYWIVYGIN